MPTTTPPEATDSLGIAAAAMVAAIDATMAERLTGWTDLVFGNHALQVYRAQVEHVPAYRAWCEHELAARGQTLDDVHRWQDVPALPIEAFKRMRVAPELAEGEADSAVWHSSGTTGAQTSSHHLRSTLLYETSLVAGARAALVPHPDDGALLAVQLAESGEAAPDSSLSHMLDAIRTRMCRDGGSWLDAEGAWECLRAATEHGDAVLLLSTSFALVQLLDACAEREPLVLPPGSRVMDTGGYKGRTRELTRDELVAQVGARLGVAPNMCENEYGMSELSSQAWLGTVARTLGQPLPQHAGGGGVDGPAVRWQPPWFRTRVVDPVTLEEVADGETGLLVHHDLANAWSCAAIRSEDIGVRHGRSYELLGRAPGAELRGCSLRLEDVLE